LGTNLTNKNCIHEEIKPEERSFVNVTLHCLLDTVLWNAGTPAPKHMPSYPRRLGFLNLCVTVVITGPLSHCNQTGKNPVIGIC